MGNSSRSGTTAEAARPASKPRDFTAISQNGSTLTPVAPQTTP
ncbi:MAG: hypothetical protein ACKO7W_24990 [Elainella sp.]